MSTSLMPNWQSYASLLRFDYYVKHLFIVPGAVVAFALVGLDQNLSLSWSVPMGLVSAFLVSSSNYIMNEWFDAETDKYHPIKKRRECVKNNLAQSRVLSLYLLTLFLGLFAAYAVGGTFLVGAICFAFNGFLYNCKPIRLKDRAYLDIACESASNPIRFALGWAIVSADTIAPLSILLVYWCVGAFLMASKRLKEMRFLSSIVDKEVLAAYRKSYLSYTDAKLESICFSLGMLSTFGTGVALVKYRPEYLLLVPPLVFLFCQLVRGPDLRAEEFVSSEKPYKEKKVKAGVVILMAMFLALSLIDIPYMNDVLSLTVR